MYRILFLVLFAAPPLTASVTWILGAANQPSSTTQLQITNSSGAIANLQISFIPTGGLLTSPVLTSLASGATLSYSDAVNQLFALTHLSGAIRIFADQPLVINATRQNSAGGTNLSVIAEEDFLNAGDIADALWVSESVDPAAGSTTRFQVYLGDANVTAELCIYDSGGNLAATKTFSGGPALFETNTASLLTAPLPIGRAELRVANGRAAASYEVRDNITGDPMAMLFAGPGNDSTTLIANAVWNGAAPAGMPLRTDLRLFNPLPVAVPVTVFDNTGKSTSITLPPNGLQEIIDLASLLNSPPGGPLSVEIQSQSSNSILAAARTAAIVPGSPGIFAEIHQLPQFDPAIVPTLITSLSNLPVGNPAGWLVARSYGGGAWQATLFDAGGNVLSTAAPVSVPAFGVIQTALSDLLGATNIPAGAQLQIAVSTGSVEVAMVQLGNNPSYAEPVQPSSGACNSPSIDVFSASQTALSSPGNVTITWQASLADSADVAPIGTGLAASASATAAVSQTTIFQITAYNSCGQSNWPMTVTVGPPAPVSIMVATGSNAGSSSSADVRAHKGVPAQAVAAASAQPGDLITVGVTNIADPTTIDSVAFQAADGSFYQVPPETIDLSGAISVRVPYWRTSQDSTNSTDIALGYITGNVTVGITTGGAPTGGVPLTILPLSYRGDPIAGFGAVLDQLTSTISDSLATLNTPDYADFTAAAQSGSAPYLSALRQMVSDVAANGSATLYWGAEPPPPDAVATTITAKDIADVTAYLTNQQQTPGTTALVRETSKPAPALASGLQCILGQAPYSYLVPYCKRVNAATEGVKNFLDSFNDDDLLNAARKTGSAPVNDILKNNPFGAVLRKAMIAGRFTQSICLVGPLLLTGFTVTPSHIPNQGSKGTVGTKVQVFPTLVPVKSQRQLMEQLESQETQGVVNVEKKKHPGLSPTDIQNLTNLIGTELKRADDNANAGIDETALTISRILNQFPSQPPQVGVCDLDFFFPLKTWNLQYVRGVSLLDVAPQSDQNWGNRDFWFTGKKPGSDKWCIAPKTDSFLLPTDIVAAIGKYDPFINWKTKTCRFNGSPIVSSVRVAGSAPPPPAGSNIVDPSQPVYDQDLTVGDTIPEIQVAYDTVLASYVDIYANDGFGYAYGEDQSFEAANGSAQFKDLPENITGSAGSTTSTVTAQQTGPNTWNATLSTNYIFNPDPNSPGNVANYSSGNSALWLKFSNPINRDNSQSVHVQVQPDAMCMGGFASGASGQGIQGNLTSFMCPAPMSCASTSTPPAWSFDNTGAVAGNISFNVGVGNNNQPGDSGGCTLTVSIQLNR